MSEETKFVKSVDTYQVNLALEIFKFRSSVTNCLLAKSAANVLENALTLKDGEKPDNSQINLARDVFTMTYYEAGNYENLNIKVMSILQMALEN